MPTKYIANVKGWGVQFGGYSNAYNAWSKGQSRSRTSVNGVKAVRLDSYSMRESTLRKEANGDMVFRFWHTDIVTIDANNICTLNLKGYNTMTTFIRIAQASGLSVWDLAPSSHPIQSTNRTRLYVNGVKYGIPFIDGMRIDLNTGVVDPRDVEHMVSDLREKYDVPSKEAAKKFKALWAELVPMLKFSINIGAWAQIAIANHVKLHNKPVAQMSQWDATIYIKSLGADHIAAAFFAGEELDDSEAYQLLTEGVKGRYSWRGKRLGNAKDQEDVTKGLRNLVPSLRKILLNEFADRLGSHDTKGGGLKGAPYFVADRDRK